MSQPAAKPMPMPLPATGSVDTACQDALLPGVSRTFALTIPELPGPLRPIVTNGYLLCRIADTIEDEPALSLDQRFEFHRRFADVVAGRADASEFARDLAPLLSDRTLATERDLVRRSADVIRVTHAFAQRPQAALRRCIEVMCSGMPRFHRGRAGAGLADVPELEAYCYHVAGCVGEMLTELFCDYSPTIDARRRGLTERAVSFGQGLQMTNILKDIWEDRERGYCWLPRDLFLRHGFDLKDLAPGRFTPGFGAGLSELIALAHGNLRDALDYTLLIPAQERGIRRFCLWALGMAVLTLRKIHAHRNFTGAREVKISRRTVKATIMASNLTTGSDRMLRWLFTICAAGLPSARPAACAEA